MLFSFVRQSYLFHLPKRCWHYVAFREFYFIFVFYIIFFDANPLCRHVKIKIKCHFFSFNLLLLINTCLVFWLDFRVYRREHVLENLSWSLFWPSLPLVALNLAKNGSWLVLNYHGNYVAGVCFKPGRTSDMELFAKISNGWMTLTAFCAIWSRVKRLRWSFLEKILVFNAPRVNVYHVT